MRDNPIGFLQAFVAVCVGITVGIAITEVAKQMKSEPTQPAAVDSRADYEYIAPVPDKRGIYKFYDISEQKICYLLFGDNGRGAISCESVDPDLRADVSAIRE